MDNAPRLLLTRALHQQHAFAEGATALGFECVRLPCIEIEPLEFDLGALPATDGWLMFTSVNAVRAFADALAQANRPWPDLPVHAIGPATVAALADVGQTVQHAPAPPYTSEAWLASTEALDLPTTIVVVKGEGGRDRLLPALHARGVDARKFDVYRRRLPLIDDAARYDAFVNRPPDIISVTSDAVLHNLLTLASPHHDARLLTLPLVVNSPRCAELAVQMGFEQPARVASPPGNEGQWQCLRDWLSDGWQG